MADLNIISRDIQSALKSIKSLNDKNQVLSDALEKLITKDESISIQLTELILKNTQLPDKIEELTEKYNQFNILVNNRIDKLATNDKLDQLSNQMNALPGKVSGSGSISQDLSDKLDQIINKTEKLSKGINTVSKEYTVEITKGGEITGGKYEANIELENNIIGAFSPTGYYFYDNTIYIYDHFAKNKESIDLPKSFHFLRIIKNDEDYKLTFCNKYGHAFYAVVSSNYNLIDATHIKSSRNIDLAHYYNKDGSNPSFIVKASDRYSNTDQRGIDVYEYKTDGNSAGKRIGSLINDLGYFDAQNQFHYTNYQMGSKTYDNPSFIITRGDNRCQSNEVRENNAIINDDYENTVDCSLAEYVANYANFLVSID
ncbi:MAG: hypothetical protein sL5_10100 [Candidatus Mesenet longicola]|uniref:Uncharacterized protein n=1 Tax=Candidatus Mesenet longicola TaxID=1892558 RepID=A0A8J3MNA9_9RICK|nr:MAG: hypothetical protein sGL2_02800 [Candidatus Mesenet longicola]GHM60017.1 MAG: hypothetical protein sL5_10100 [Candidatus Mesenet longicola]